MINSSINIFRSGRRLNQFFFQGKRKGTRKNNSLILRKLRLEQGSAIFLTVMMLASIITVVLLSATLVVGGIRKTRSQEYSATAYFAAETGAERVFYLIRKKYFYLLRADDSPCIAGDYIFFNPAFVSPTQGAVGAYCGICASNPCVDPLVMIDLQNGVYGDNMEDIVYSVKYTGIELPLGHRIWQSSGFHKGIRRLVQIKYQF